MIFVISEIVCIPTNTSSALIKNRSMRVPVYSLAPRTGSDPPFWSDRGTGRDMMESSLNEEIDDGGSLLNQANAGPFSVIAKAQRRTGS